MGKIEVAGKRVLVVHQQVRANTIRTLLEQNGAEEVTVATWFLQKPELKREGDIRLTEEDQLQALLEQGKYRLAHRRQNHVGRCAELHRTGSST